MRFMTIQHFSNGVRTRLRFTAQHNHIGCRSTAAQENLQQFFSDLEAMTAQEVLKFRIACEDCGTPKIPLERALELVEQARDYDEWEDLFELEQNWDSVLAGVYH
jgi:hypothetical protein